MECSIRLQLATKYLEARTIFQAAVKNHQQRIHTCPEEFILLRLGLKNAYRALERAENELYQHSKEHCCA